MRLFRHGLLIVLLSLSMTLGAQDIHYSLFDMSPLTLNPALTGAYSGTARIGGIIRDQWQSQLSWNGYRTPSFYIDAPIVRGFRKKDWIGIGLVTITDEVGPANLKLNATTLSVSYHAAMDKKGDNILTLGLAYGKPSRSVNLSGNSSLLFEDEIISAYDLGSTNYGQNSPDRGGSGAPSPGSSDSGTKRSYSSFNAGLMYRAKLDKRESLEIGVALHNLLSPDVKTLVTGTPGSGGGNKSEFTQPSRLNLHAIYQRPVNEKTTLTPKVMFQSMAGAWELVAQGWLGYQLKEDMLLRGGLGYRVGRSGQLLLGMDSGDLRVNFAYDIGLNSLASDRPSNDRDASDPAPYDPGLGIRYPMSFELAAYYVLKMYKKPNIDPVILCPRF